MKSISHLAILAVLAALPGATAFGQFGGPGPEFGPPPDQRSGPFTNRPPALTAAQRAAQLATNYAALAVYDVNHDGQFDATEQATVIQALTDGKLQPPAPPRRPGGGTAPTPPPEMAQRLATQVMAVYAAIAPYDANHDGLLDDPEQTALATAIADGTLKLRMPGGPGRGMRGRPPGGADGFQPPGPPR